MNKFLAMAVAASALATAAPASAQAWQSINQRQANLDARIDAGVRDRSLSRPEANRLRGEFNDLVRLESRYRQGGLSMSERADLDRRFDRLSAQIRVQRADDETRGGGRGNNWIPINQRQRNLDQRIDMGVRDRSLSRIEAAGLRTEFRNIAALEARYRQGGLSMGERADLDRRFDRLSGRVQAERSDRNNRWG